MDMVEEAGDRGEGDGGGEGCLGVEGASDGSDCAGVAARKGCVVAAVVYAVAVAVPMLGPTDQRPLRASLRMSPPPPPVPSSFLSGGGRAPSVTSLPLIPAPITSPPRLSPPIPPTFPSPPRGPSGLPKTTLSPSPLSRASTPFPPNTPSCLPGPTSLLPTPSRTASPTARALCPSHSLLSSPSFISREDPRPPSPLPPCSPGLPLRVFPLSPPPPSCRN